MPEITVWVPENGDFFRPRQPSGLVHIAVEPGPNDPPGGVRAACGRGNFYFNVRPAHGDDPRQCTKCWEAF